jgi:amylosucrase
MMQAHSFFLGGVPMIFYGDETGYINDYSYLSDAGKTYDNRWMHRPVIDWEKNKKIEEDGTTENCIFTSTQKLISLRKKFSAFADHKNLTWLTPHNIHVAGLMRAKNHQKLFCLFNFSKAKVYVTWYLFKEQGEAPLSLYDHWNEKKYIVGADHEYLIIEPFSFCVLEPQ